MGNEFIIKNGFVSKGNSEINVNANILGNTTLSGNIKNTGSVTTFNSAVPNITNKNVWKLSNTIGSPQNTTLPDGEEGQHLTCYLINDPAGITVSAATGTFSTVRLGDVGDSFSVVYHNIVGWIITESYGVSILN